MECQRLWDDQEAYATFTQVDPDATEQDHLLKAVGDEGWWEGLVEVMYDAPNQRLQAWTYEWPAEWVQHGVDIPVTTHR